MKLAAAFMLVFCLLLAGLTWWRGGVPMVMEGLKVGFSGSLRLVPVLVVVFVMTGFVQVLLPKEVVSTWLSDTSGFRGLLVAWVAGILTPGGGPIGLTVAAAFLKAGAGVGVLVTYLTSMALLSFIRIPLELGLYGARLTAIRIGSSLVLPLIAGAIAQLLARLSAP